MNNDQLATLSKLCEETYDCLLPMVEKGMAWAQQKTKLFKEFENESEDYSQLMDELGDNWNGGMLNQYVMGKIFGSTQRLKKFLNHERNGMGKKEKQLLRHFLQTPWFYSVFSVEDVLNDEFIRIYDHSRESSHLLNASVIKEAYDSGCNLFLCLLFDNGECCQTFGLVGHLSCFSLEEIEGFAFHADNEIAGHMDLARSIETNPVPFMLLTPNSYAAEQIFKNPRAEFCFNSITVDAFDTSELPEEWEVQEKNDIVFCRRGDASTPEEMHKIFFMPKHYLLFMRVTGLENYRSLTEGVLKKYNLPPQPAWLVSAAMEFTMDNIYGLYPITEEFETIIQQDTPPTEEQLANLTRIHENFSNAEHEEHHHHEHHHEHAHHHHHHDHDHENCSHSHSHSHSHEPFTPSEEQEAEINRKLKDKIAEQTEAFKKELKGGFSDLTAPTPEETTLFKKSALGECELFIFNKSAKLEKILNDRLKQIEQDEPDEKELRMDMFPVFIEELYGEYFNNARSATLLYTLYLLLKKGEEFESVEDYAMECLKQFWETLLPAPTIEVLPDIIRIYSSFIYDAFYQITGLVEPEKPANAVEVAKGNFKIKTTAFFREWIQLK